MFPELAGELLSETGIDIELDRTVRCMQPLRQKIPTT
jgi:hypothetical protein